MVLSSAGKWKMTYEHICKPIRNAPVCCIIKSYTCTCCKTHTCMHHISQDYKPRYRLFYIFLLLMLMLPADSMDFLSVAGAAACFQQSKSVSPSVEHLSVTDEEIFNQSVIKCGACWRALLTHRFCQPGGISATRRGVGISGNTELKMPR